MNLILIGKGSILFSIVNKLSKNKKLKVRYIFWDKNFNNSEDKYLLKHLKNKYKVFCIKNINSIKYFNLLKSLKFEYILSVNNTQIFKSHIVEKFKNKIINYHYSLIPSYKGLYSCTKVILRNEKFTGISWHFVTEKIDNGPIIFQKKLKIQNNDNAARLIIKLNKLCINTFSVFLKRLNKKKFTLPSKKNKDFKLKIKDNKYSEIYTNMCSKMIFQKFRAFDYYPFISPLPKIKIKLDKFLEVKNILIIKKPKIKINRFLKISESEYIIKTKDGKYLNIFTSN